MLLWRKAIPFILCFHEIYNTTLRKKMFLPEVLVYQKAFRIRNSNLLAYFHRNYEII